MSGVIITIGGVVFASFALLGMFFAGSDYARISGKSHPLAVASIALAIAALLLEYHA